MRLNNTITLILMIALFESIGFYLSLPTQSNLYPWYESLNKSSLTPPGFVFSVTWTLLYAILAVVAWMLINENQQSARKVKHLFIIQMLMNWAWTPLFFTLHWLTFSAIWIIILSILNIILILWAKAINKTMAWLLSPYLLWLLFASYLNLVIAWVN